VCNDQRDCEEHPSNPKRIYALHLPRSIHLFSHVWCLQDINIIMDVRFLSEGETEYLSFKEWASAVCLWWFDDTSSRIRYFDPGSSHYLADACSLFLGERVDRSQKVAYRFVSIWGSLLKLLV
jgi:hypothetical protein